MAALDAAGLAAALGELEEIVAALVRGSAYAGLLFDADTRAPRSGALLTRLEEHGASVSSLTAFFDLEWVAVSDAHARRLLRDPALERFAHHLGQLRLSAPHRLSEPEERLLSEKSRTGVLAWKRLLDEELARLAPRIDGREVGLDAALAAMRAPDRAERAAADEAITACLEPGLELRGRVLNVLLHERAIDDRLRGFEHWLAEFNLDNEASDAHVEALVESVLSRSGVAHGWLALKARVLGLERLGFHDVGAPVGALPAEVSWEYARETVIHAYAGFSDELGALVARFFDERWVDAAPRPGKRAGAYCMATVPEAHPYVLLNFGGTVEDVLALAHELGHGIHGMLSAPRGILSMTPPLTLAETASVFGETLTVARLLEEASDPAVRFGILAQQLDGIVATVFRQIMIHRFERQIHTERRESGELSVARLGELWLALTRETYGDGVEVSEDHSSWWSHVAHVFTAPGYVYTYAYGQLLALSLYQRYRELGDAFVPQLLVLLRAGGSRAPDEALREVGVELGDPGFWSQGLALAEDLLAQAHTAAVALA